MKIGEIEVVENQYLDGDTAVWLDPHRIVVSPQFLCDLTQCKNCPSTLQDHVEGKCPYGPGRYEPLLQLHLGAP